MRYVMVVVLAAFVWSGVRAQETPPWGETPAGEVFYALMGLPGVETVYRGIRDAPEIGVRVLEAMYEVLEARSDGSDVVRDEVCGFLAGAGARPKLDGGGPMVQALDHAPGDASLVDAMGLQGFGFPQRPLVVIDEFDLTALVTSIHDSVHHEGPLQLGDDAAYERLWTTTYRFMLDLDASRPPDEVAVPHGHLVLYHLLRALGPEGAVSAAQVLGPGHAELVVRSGSGSQAHAESVYLVSVDLGDIASVRAALDPTMIPADAAVVMSWGLVDCGLEARYGAEVLSDPDAAYRAFVEYMHDAIAESPHAAALFSELCAAHQVLLDAWPDGEDVRRACLTGDGGPAVAMLTMAALAAVDVRAANALADIESVVFVQPPPVLFASAGNQGLGFPLPPAAWDGVHGVAACEHGTPGRASFSNVAGFEHRPEERLLALGATFVAPPLVPGEVPSTMRGYAGTSFAAPYAAAAYASGWWGLSLTPDVLGCQE